MPPMRRPSPTPDPAAFRRALLAWYRRHKRLMPWRDTGDPYRIWLCEVILQQTRVEQGTPYYERFVAAYPTVHALAGAPEDAVLKLWEGLGYYSRARNLHRAAKIVSAEMGGEFPRTADALEKLPGIGRYTAAAIASIAFNEPAAVLDGNVMRVLARLYAIEESIDAGPTRKRLWELAGDLVAPRAPGDFNQGIMELGSTVCKPAAPLCGSCPVRAHCAAFARGLQDRLPIRKEKTPTPHHEMVAAAIKRNGRYLLGQRPQNGLLGGLWELPNGRVEPGESHEMALRRIVRAATGLAGEPGGMIASVKHAYSHFRITLTVYAFRAPRGRAAPDGGTPLRWVPRRGFEDLAFPKSHHKFLDLLR